MKKRNRILAIFLTLFAVMAINFSVSLKSIVNTDGINLDYLSHQTADASEVHTNHELLYTTSVTYGWSQSVVSYGYCPKCSHDWARITYWYQDYIRTCYYCCNNQFSYEYTITDYHLQCTNVHCLYSEGINGFENTDWGCLSYY